MTLSIFQVLFDGGMFVLIWIVQLIVYPSFLYISKEKLVLWHNIYTGRFMFIVMPLMLGQLVSVIYQLVISINFYTVLMCLVVLILWGLTFFLFIPIHSKISESEGHKKVLNSLVSKNWGRTFLWTLQFGISLVYLISYE